MELLLILAFLCFGLVLLFSGSRASIEPRKSPRKSPRNTYRPVAQLHSEQRAEKREMLRIVRRLHAGRACGWLWRQV